MTLYPKGTRKKAGLAPGTLVRVGEPRTERVVLTLTEYGGDGDFAERALAGVEEALPLKPAPGVAWISVEGVHDLELLRRLGEVFGLHPLVLEDIAHTNQRPKVEDYGGYVFVVMRALFYDEKKHRIEAEQIAIVLGRNFVITFVEKERGLLEPLRKRIREGSGRLRNRGADYLLYAVMDVLVDSYFVVFESFGERIEELENTVVRASRPGVVREILDAKVNMMVLRRAIWPLRDLINVLIRDDIALVGGEVEVYLRDVHDHAVQLIETVEITRDMVFGLTEIHLSVMNNRMNEVIKVLTLIATIFIPLTFISGVYGMNFKYMPELEWRPGYFVILGVMAAVGGGLLAYFRRKKWI